MPSPKQYFFGHCQVLPHLNVAGMERLTLGGKNLSNQLLQINSCQATPNVNLEHVFMSIMNTKLTNAEGFKSLSATQKGTNNTRVTTIGKALYYTGKSEGYFVLLCVGDKLWTFFCRDEDLQLSETRTL
jgi:hypothetical protein